MEAGFPFVTYLSISGMTEFLNGLGQGVIDEISVVVRLKALSKPVGRRKFYRQWRFPGELSAGEDEGEESQGTASTRGTKEMRSQLADTLVGGEDNGGSARVNRGGQPGKVICTGLDCNSNGLRNEVGSAHETLVSNFSRDGGLVISVPHASLTHKNKGPTFVEKPAAELPFERGPNAFLGPRVSFSNPIEVSGPGLRRVIDGDGEDDLRCRSAMESNQFPPCDDSGPVDRALQILSPTHRELNTEEIHLGLADVVNRSVRELQGFNERPETGIQELMEVIRTSEKQINEVEEGHFEIHEVSTSINQGVADSSFHGGLQVLPDFSFSGGRVQDGLSSPLQSNSLCPVLDVSLVDTAIQGVIAAIPRATVIESTLVSESLHANIFQGQVKDNQCRISKNHFDKGGQIFSGEKEETERWLHELSKYATCPIEESEIPYFLPLLQVMGLSLVRIKDMFGSGRVSNRSTRGSVVRKEERERDVQDRNGRGEEACEEMP
ncbi:hypothetical protein LOK49_LG12G00145 [Camellia lanceoleosa]|uniref:Uncharacterized protein n=1 Tax=Camellia lanceoleosa TaxID=1840588 RepID=A0ACC0FS70_9ERIC|nr:hypothetical protein LOK49_LG12G00145 [Camellia lanceoleosa]